MALSAPPIIDRPLTTGVRQGLSRDEVMTASEVADLLHLPVSTVYYLARRGEIPACRLGRAWRFVRPRIEEMLGASAGSGR
jgi:excisionase family DNA binding protein